MYKNEITGIYKIQSKIKSERIYVGSAVKMKDRWKTHKLKLRHNTHHSITLQRHFNKYGEDDLEFSVLLICEREDLMPIGGIIMPEQMFFSVFKYKDTNKPYFNSVPTAGSTMGIHLSEEHKKSLSIALKGRVFSEEHCRKISESNKGKKMSEETKAKLRKPKTEEHKAKLRGKRPQFCGKNNSMYGKHHSEESKKKQSELVKEQFKNGRINPMKGKHHTEETKQKIREKRLARIAMENN